MKDLLREFVKSFIYLVVGLYVITGAGALIVLALIPKILYQELTLPYTILASITILGIITSWVILWRRVNSND